MALFRKKKGAGSTKDETIKRLKREKRKLNSAIGKIRLALFIFLGSLLALTVLSLFFEIGFKDRVYPWLELDGQSIGGLSEPALKVFLENRVGLFNREAIKLQSQAKFFSLKPSDFGLVYDIDGTVDRLLRRSSKPEIPDRLTALFAGWFSGREASFQFEYDSGALAEKIVQIAEQVDRPERDLRLEIKGDQVEILTDVKAGSRLDRAALEQALAELWPTAKPATLVLPIVVAQPSVSLESVKAAKIEAERIMADDLVFSFQERQIVAKPALIGGWLETFPETGSLKVLVNEERLREYLDKEVRSKIDRKAKDARLEIKNGKAVVFQASEDGLTVDQNRLSLLTRDLLESRRKGLSTGVATIEVTAAVTEAKIADKKIGSLGLKELIGKAKTSFKGSPDNRIHNIKTGVEFLSGAIIPPGEEFSTLDELGEVDALSGYLPELVIKENRTIPEYGGGLCQVSTTLFRAALNAGLPITERQNHSYRVSYYERGIGPGLDATIYSPRPNLKFKNDTGKHIMVQGYVFGDEVSLEIYGTSDGRKSEIKGPFASDFVPAPAPIYIETSNLPTGEKKQIEKPHAGASAIAYYTVYRGGEAINKQIFRSKYKAWPARFLVGVGPAPAPPSESSPAVPPTDSTPTEAVPVVAEPPSAEPPPPPT